MKSKRLWLIMTGIFYTVKRCSFAPKGKSLPENKQIKRKTIFATYLIFTTDLTALKMVKSTRKCAYTFA